MEAYPAVRMRLWINCLQETWRLTQMSIVTIMNTGITEKDIGMEMGMAVGKLSMAVQEMGADVSEQV